MTLTMHYASRRRPAIRAFFRLSALIGALCLGSIAQAWAHAFPETQTPAAGAVVAVPQEVRITYDAALEPAFSSLVVSDARGKQVSSAKAEVDATTHKTMRVTLPAMPAGVYQVKW